MNAQEMAATQLQAKLYSLTMVGMAISCGCRLDPDTEELTCSDEESISLWQYLAEMVLEAKTPEYVGWTDFTLAMGGPTVWLRHTTVQNTEHGRTPEQWFIMATANGMDEPEELLLTSHEHEFALIACEAIWEERVCPC